MASCCGSRVPAVLAAVRGKAARRVLQGSCLSVPLKWEQSYSMSRFLCVSAFQAVMAAAHEEWSCGNLAPIRLVLDGRRLVPRVI